MLGRLITTIVCLVLLAFFAGFNLDNKCNVNLLFHTFQNVPVFFTIITSFVVGIVFTIPFAFIRRGKSGKKDRLEKIKDKNRKSAAENSAKPSSKTSESSSGAESNGKTEANIIYDETENPDLNSDLKKEGNQKEGKSE